VPLHHLKEKEKEKENQEKRNIKSRKIDKSKRKMLVFKCTITLLIMSHMLTKQNALQHSPSLKTYRSRSEWA